MRLAFWISFWITVGFLVVFPMAFGGSDALTERGWALVLWELVPVAIAAFLWLFEKRWYAIWWLVPVAILLFTANLEIFIWPSSSTAALLALFVPVWSLFVVGPISLLIGRLTLLVRDRWRAR